MQARAHPVAFLRRRRDGDGRRQSEPADAAERVGNHLRLDRELTRVGDVRVERAAADGIDERLAPVRRRLLDRDRVGVRDALGHAIDARLDALAGDRAPDEDDLAAGARDHPAAGRGPLDRQRRRAPGRDHRAMLRALGGRP